MAPCIESFGPGCGGRDNLKTFARARRIDLDQLPELDAAPEKVKLGGDEVHDSVSNAWLAERLHMVNQ